MYTQRNIYGAFALSLPVEFQYFTYQYIQEGRPESEDRLRGAYCHAA
jgi:hypothetical protein